MSVARWRRAAVLFLTAESVGGGLWWLTLAVWPASRSHFHPATAPELVLWSLATPDLLLFVLAAGLAALGLNGTPTGWAWPLLCVHSGAACYAGLMCLHQCWLAPETWLAAALMSPSLLLLPVFVWTCRPRQDA